MRVRVVVALLLLVSVTAQAQRRGGRGGMGGTGGMGRGGMGGGRRGGGNSGDMALADAGEFRKLNPAGLIVDTRKKLSLDEAQVTALSAMRDRSRDGNEPILVHYDSVRKVLRSALANRRDRRQQATDDSTQDNALQVMRTMRFLIDTLSARREADVREVLDYVKDEKQHDEAAKLLKDQDLTFQEKLPRLGGRGRRAGES